MDLSPNSIATPTSPPTLTTLGDSSFATNDVRNSSNNEMKMSNNTDRKKKISYDSIAPSELDSQGESSYNHETYYCEQNKNNNNNIKRNSVQAGEVAKSTESRLSLPVFVQQQIVVDDRNRSGSPSKYADMRDGSNNKLSRPRLLQGNPLLDIDGSDNNMLTNDIDIIDTTLSCSEFHSVGRSSRDLLTIYSGSELSDSFATNKSQTSPQSKGTNDDSTVVKTISFRPAIDISSDSLHSTFENWLYSEKRGRKHRPHKKNNTPNEVNNLPIEVEILNKIGRGSFAEVFLASIINGPAYLIGNLIAVKEIHSSKEICNTPKKLHKLEREIRVMAKLNHTNIVKYLGSKRNEEGISIFMEYADGGTVGDILRESGPMTEAVAAGYIRQLVAGLIYLHTRKNPIIHRDLKSDNFFLANGKQDLKLGDFGTSKEMISTWYSDSITGTPNFMAPEMVECSGHSVPADVWSVGCCAIEMTKGKAPFHALDNQLAVMFAVINGKLPSEIPPNSSEELSDFIKVCTYLEPQSRWPITLLKDHIWLRESERMSSKEDISAHPGYTSSNHPPLSNYSMNLT